MVSRDLYGGLFITLVSSCPHGAFHGDTIRFLSRFWSSWELHADRIRIFPALVSSWQLHADWIHYLPGFLVL
ncbi:hypothetical protein ACFOYZ_10850, partial [Neobacillus cucumis]|uniref:hypothetical protein n=1 Tax=Neobacillus cucumis TaxID=1740721 RepID=UPI00360B95D2